MRLLFAMAWRNVWRQKRRTFLTAMAMAVALAFCCAMLTLTNGVSNQMFNLMVEQQLGHIQIYHKDYPTKGVLFDTIPAGNKALAVVQGMEGTQIATGRLKGYGLVGSGMKSSGGQLVGVFPEFERGLTPILRQLEVGEYLPNEASHQVVIGVDLAKKLQVSVGGELIIVGQGSDGSTANDLFTVVGIVKTGNLGTDKAGVFLHVADLQEFLVMGDQLHEILALTYDEEEIATFVGEIQDTFKADQLMTDAEDETLGVYPWWETNKQMAEMLAMQDSAIGIMIFLILMVSGFGILNTMMMSVFERTRELGVIRALGISRPRMVLVVVMESVVLAAFACLVGLAMGGVLSLYLTVVGLDFSVKDGEGFSFAGVVFDPIFKGVISANDFVTPVLAVFVISALASLWPATRAAFLRPVEALRQD